MSGIEEQIKLASKIIKGQINKAGVQKELDRIAVQYGEDCFNSYPVKRKPKPWSDKDVKELEVLSASGAVSKEFYLYMAEVCEEVYGKAANRRKLAGIGMLVFVLLIIIVMAAIIKFV